MQAREDTDTNSHDTCSHHTDADHAGPYDPGADYSCTNDTCSHNASTDHTGFHNSDSHDAGTNYTGADSDAGAARPTATAIYSHWSRFLGSGRCRYVR